MGFAETFKALSHPIRREILELLKSERLPAGDIAGHFDVAGATISHHLNILKKAGLVVEKREKKFYLLRIKYVSFRRYYDMVSGFKGGVRK